MDRESPDSPANTPQYPATFAALLVDGESIRIFVSQWQRADLGNAVVSSKPDSLKW
jgi:hypothetical protein